MLLSEHNKYQQVIRMFWKSVRKLFIRPKWESLLVTQKMDDFFRIRELMVHHPIKTKTRFLNGYNSGRNPVHFGFMDSYEILVKAVDLHKAHELIQRQKES